LTHGNFSFETSAVLAAVTISPDDEAILFLPMAHIFAKVLVAVQMRVGFPVAFAESVAKTLDNVAEINPTIFPSVPRLYEKIHAVASDKVAEKGGLTKTIFDWSLGVGKEAARARAKNEPMGALLSIRYAIAKKLVLDKIKARFGSRIRFAICGGAPLAEELCVWFHGAGVEIYEGYGLTESTAASNITHPGALRFGTVGRAMEGVDVKLASDGEVLIRGGNVMKGYYKKPEETAAVMDPDGFFHSGDIGVIDADGYLKITDRKKDILVTAGGKNVAPQNIENLLKQAPMVSQVVVLGDNKPYLVALVTLDPDAAARFAKENGKSDDLTKLATDADAIARIKTEVDAVNGKLSQYETIKKFVILPKDFSIESGELTPTLKVKRKVVAERYASEVDALYASGKE
ncbi:MAG TPA: AMP-binding protein, partial [Polyangiaceae bacterium]